MDGADGWSDVAAEWSQLWGAFPRSVHEAIIRDTGIRVDSRVLDAGCGSGEFLRTLVGVGAMARGVDPAPGMVALAGLDAHLGDFDALPWPDATFDVVTAINALQFADDSLAALAEARRVTRPGGFIAVANWAESARNDLDVIEHAVAAYWGDEVTPDGDLRREGGLEQLFADAGLVLTVSRVIVLPWEVRDEATLVRGVLLGEDAETQAALTDTVVAAAERFRVGEGFVLRNAFRLAVGRSE